MTVSQRYTYFISVLMYNCIKFPEVYATLSNCFDFVKNILQDMLQRRPINCLSLEQNIINNV